MTTARDIVKRALRKIHVLGRGQSLGSDEAQDALDALNGLISSWSVEGNLVFEDKEETFTLDGSASYTIGTSGDFNTEVPFAINTAYVSSGGLDYYLNSISLEEYNQINLKDTGAIPDCYYFDYSYPIARIYLYPVATSGYTLTLNTLKRLSSIAGLSSTLSLPPEYERALVFNLAIEMAPDYEKEASPSVRKIADESKKNVEAANSRNKQAVLMKADYPNSGDSWNIYKGSYV